MSSGNKYHRTIYQLFKYEDDCTVQPTSIKIDVYSVITAYEVTNPGLQHCIKKVLCAGIRGKANQLQDLREARDALDRAIEDAERDVILNEKPEVSEPPVHPPLWKLDAPAC